MKYQLTDIVNKAAAIERLELHSFETNVYLVKLCIDGHLGLVYHKDTPKRFHNTQQVRDTFQTCEVREAVMVHASPYDEMIGNPPKAESSMVLPFSMQQPY